MKRSELKLNEEYAVLAPSQKVSGWTRGRHVVVLDIAPKWVAREMSWWSHRDIEAHETRVTYRGQRVAATDLTYEAEPGGYRSREAASGVKVLEVFDRQAYHVTVVPLSQVRMTWRAFTLAKNADRRAQEERWAQTNRERKNAEARRQALVAARDRLSSLLGDDETAVRVRVLDGELALVGDEETLRGIIDRAGLRRRLD